MKKSLHLLWLLALGLALAACQAQPGPTEGGYTPKYEKADCPFEALQNAKVECGYLTVPEDRAAPAGKTVRLAVARLKASLPNPAPDPIVYLEGGPGGSALREMLNYSVLMAPYAQKRDVIFIDQRGTGYSQPALDCPEQTRLALDTLNVILSPQDGLAKANQALQACRDRLKAAGANLAAYNSAASAADLADLRRALGIKEWNLYGTSYGTRLALTVLRDAPAGVRAVLIDSVMPLQASMVTEPVGNFARALNLLFDSCAADAACSAAYPDLKNVFYETVRKLNAAPVKFKLTQPDLGGIGQPGAQLDAQLDGNGLVNLLHTVFYDSSLLPSVPALIYEAKAGRFGMLAQLQGQMLSQLKDISQGFYYSVECSEDVPFDTPAAAAAAFAAQPAALAEALGPPTAFIETCKLWGVPAAAALENQAVKSDVPTLVVAGRFDPITPPAWGQQAAATLSKSTFIEAPAGGHGPSLTQLCPQQIALAFLDNPAAAPDSACLAQGKLAFAVPLERLELAMAPFDNRLMAVSTLVPASWKPVSGLPGYFTPDGSTINPTQLSILGAPMTQEQYLAAIRPQLTEAGILLQPSSQKFAIQSAGGLKWTFYEADAGLIKIDLALATSGKTTYCVQMQSQWHERQALLKAVFIPVLEALIGK